MNEELKNQIQEKYLREKDYLERYRSECWRRRLLVFLIFSLPAILFVPAGVGIGIIIMLVHEISCQRDQSFIQGEMNSLATLYPYLRTL